jgi:hypothetical protein
MPVSRLARSTPIEPVTAVSFTVSVPSGPEPFPWILKALGQPVAKNSMLPALFCNSTCTGDDVRDAVSFDWAAWAPAATAVSSVLMKRITVRA